MLQVYRSIIIILIAMFNTEAMEFHLSFSSTVAAIFAIILFAFLLQFLNRKKAKEGNRKPPQAKGAWPIIGHLHLLGGSQLSHELLGEMAETYGPIFTIKLGFCQALVVSSGEIAKECFTTNDKLFADRPKAVAVELMGYNNTMFGFAPYGAYWREMRKVVTHVLLSQRKVENFGRIRVSEVRASMNGIYQAWVKNKESEDSDMLKVDMKQWLENLTLNVIVRIMSGKRYSLDDEEGVRFRVVLRKFVELLGAFVVSDFIPYLKFLDLGGNEKAMKITAKDMDQIIGGWLEEHKRKKESRVHHADDQVIMDVLISILEDASKDEFAGFDHDKIIKSTCQTILSGGLDTTTVTLTWALSLLLNNPKLLQIAQDELDEHVGKDRLVEESDIKNLVYLQAIIKETLRLYPAAPLSVPHESREDCVVGGYNIPKGTRLVVNLWKLHRDPKIWSNPYEFCPERFLKTQKDVDVKGNHFELIPFGSGRRMCPGLQFALHALPITMASLIQQFELKRPSNGAIDMTGSNGLTNKKAGPFEVFLAPRLSPNLYDVGA